MPFYEDDLDVFFEEDEFAVSAVIGTGVSEKTIKVIFDEPYEKYDSSAGAVVSYAPVALAKASDVSEFSRGVYFSAKSKDYKVIDFQPDGTGLTKIILQGAL